MSVGPTRSDKPLSISEVLRAALEILRRRAKLYVALAILLVLLPDLLSEAVADAVTSALPVTDDLSVEELLPHLIVGLGAALALATILLGPVVLEAIVLLTTLKAQRRASLNALRVIVVVRRVLPLAVAVSAVEIGSAIWASEHGWVPVSALSALWLVTLPVLVAETDRLSSLPGRLRALARGNWSIIARLLLAYLILCISMGEVQLNLPDFQNGGSVQAWALHSSASALIAASALLADATTVALYLRLRQAEAASWSSEFARAFD